MKLGSVTKIDKRNKTTSKKIDDDVMLENFDVTVIFLIYGQLGAIRKQESGQIIRKMYIFVKSNLLFYKS